LGEGDRKTFVAQVYGEGKKKTETEKGLLLAEYIWAGKALKWFSQEREWLTGETEGDIPAEACTRRRGIILAR